MHCILHVPNTQNKSVSVKTYLKFILAENTLYNSFERMLKEHELYLRTGKSLLQYSNMQ